MMAWRALGWSSPRNCVAKSPRSKTLLGWGRGVKFPNGSFRMLQKGQGGCCMSTCAGPQNDDFPLVLQVFWRGRTEGDAKRREKKELKWVLKEQKP